MKSIVNGINSEENTTLWCENHFECYNAEKEVV